MNYFLIEFKQYKQIEWIMEMYRHENNQWNFLWNAVTMIAILKCAPSTWRLLFEHLLLKMFPQINEKKIALTTFPTRKPTIYGMFRGCWVHWMCFTEFRNANYNKVTCHHIYWYFFVFLLYILYPSDMPTISNSIPVLCS